MHILLDPDARPVVGHRGNRAHAPENTIESFRQAVALGVDALEMDVHLSADGEVVVIHDGTVDRTTNGSGAVAALSSDTLRRLDAGYRFTADGGRSFPYRAQGVGIPLLRDVLAAFPDTPLLIEIKTPDASVALRAVIERHAATSRCIVESFHDDAGRAFAESAIAVGASQGDVTRLLWRAVLRRPASSVPFRFMSIPTSFRGVPVPIAGLVVATRPAGAPVHVWTVNAPADAERLWARGVCAIISDDPATMLALRPRVLGRATARA
jgi:glycerophosphoryl diester phosphodiesterase